MESLGEEDLFYIDHETMLGRIGVSLDQINYVVIDHTCFDHPGGVDLFPNATVIIEKAAFDQPNPLGFPLPDGTIFNLALEEDYAKLAKIQEEGRLKMVDGDYEIAPGLKMYHAPGHTYETNFLEINTKDGNVVLTGDSCYTYLNLEYNLLPPGWVVTDADLLLQSYERIRQVMGSSDALLVPGHDMDVFKRFPRVTDRIVQIKLPHVQYNNVFSMSLRPGLNMISLPLKPETPYTARSFAEELSATTVITLDEALQRFVGFTLDAPDDGFPIEGGKGYIVNVPEAKVIAFTGAAWTNETPIEAAPILPPKDGTWAFVVSGRLLDDSNDSLKKDGYLVTVRNTRTNAVATDVVRSRYFAAAFANLNRKNVVQTSDRLEIQVRNQAGEIVSDTLSYAVTSEAIRQAFLPLTLKNVEVPRQSLLLQNYPNPFNPETWIPYQIREPAEVAIRIYDVQGRLVHTLDLGQRQPGFYLGRTKAAYWDGRNFAGEKVASGIYFYQIKAGDFFATRRMLIVK